MAKSLGTLGDLFPDQDLSCSVHGCGSMLPRDHAAATAGDAERPRGMCDRCYAELARLADRAVPCASPGCTGTWTWRRLDQLEAARQGQHQPPRRTCDGCRDRRRQLQDRQLPCKLRGCRNTFTWTAEEQWHDGPDHPPSRLCADCFARLRTLADREVPCRINGCTGTWSWNRFQQLEHLLAGKSLDQPGRRMCRSCMDKIRDLQDVQLPCRIKGCTRQWTFTAFAQLETLLTHDPAEPPAPRMCPECFHFLGSAQDRQISCRHRGCPNHWLYTRQMQLYDAAAGRKSPAPRLCQACADKIKATAVRLEPCATPGCKGHWKYSPADQVRDAVGGRHAAPSHRCSDCEAFLAHTQAAVLACPRCGKDMPWSAYEQLLCKLGTFSRPERCSGCAEQELALQRPAEPPIAREHRQVVRIPAAGRWSADAAIAHRPPHLTPETLTDVEAADIRIVALGDDLTWSAPEAATAWPALLQARLNGALAGKARVAVVNAGIPRTTSQQAVVRLPRDVVPFGPHVVLFSFLFADALLERHGHDRRWRALLPPENALRAAEDLCRRLQTLKCRLLFWTPNPILPLDLAEHAPHDQPLVDWATAQEAHYEQVLAHVRRVCTDAGIPVLDLRSRFEVNGRKSARKWMGDWYSHNAAGAQNIATWMAEWLLHEKRLPLPDADA